MLRWAVVNTDYCSVLADGTVRLPPTALLAKRGQRHPRPLLTFVAGRADVLARTVSDLRARGARNGETEVFPHDRDPPCAERATAKWRGYGGALRPWPELTATGTTRACEQRRWTRAPPARRLR